jgi:hypothetical protein
MGMLRSYEIGTGVYDLLLVRVGLFELDEAAEVGDKSFCMLVLLFLGDEFA